MYTFIATKNRGWVQGREEQVAYFFVNGLCLPFKEYSVRIVLAYQRRAVREGGEGRGGEARNTHATHHVHSKAQWTRKYTSMTHSTQQLY